MSLALADRLTIAEAALREGRIIQNDWRREEGGREMVCALAAFGPDINRSDDCPAELMPRWLAHLVPILDDRIAAGDVPWFMGELLKRARAWSVLDAAAWERARTGFLIGTVRQALDSAAAIQPDPIPAYWQQVSDAVGRTVDALRSGDGKKLGEARAAAHAAAYAAYAAADAARAPADAARAPADAARAAHAVADAAHAAHAAGRSLAELLFNIIDGELDQSRKRPAGKSHHPPIIALSEAPAKPEGRI